MIARALILVVGNPPDGDPHGDITNPRFELPPADEDRVVKAVLLELER